MKKVFILMLTCIGALSAVARDFTYTYGGITLTYTVLDEKAKTCETKAGELENGGIKTSGHDLADLMDEYNNVSLIIPSHPMDGDVEYTLVRIGDASFVGMSKEGHISPAFLSGIAIPRTVTSIGKMAFVACHGEQCFIPESVNVIEADAFGDATFRSVMFESMEALCEIDFESPYSNPGLNSIELYVDELIIGVRVDDYEVGTTVNIPESITELKPFTFLTYPIESVNIPESVVKIGEYTFGGCSKLTSVEIPNSVRTIDSKAFYVCEGLKKLVMSNNIESIGYDAFGCCDNIESVYYMSENPKAVKNCFSYDVYDNATLWVPSGSIDKFYNVSPWNWFQNIREEGSSGIDNIAADNNGRTEIYNLQGIRMNDAAVNLPDGLYIINGKKTYIGK